MKKSLFFIGILVFIILVTDCNNIVVNDTSALYIENDTLYYTNNKGDLLEFSLTDKYSKTIAINFQFVAYNANYFIGYSDNIIKIYDRNNKNITTIEEINASSIAISDNVIFYSNLDDKNYIYSINIFDNNKSKFLEETTNKIAVNEKYLFFEKDSNYIYSYNFHSKKIEEFFVGNYCYYFNCDDKNIYLSDYSQKNEVIKIDISTKESEKILNKSALDFFVDVERIFYISIMDYDNYKKFEPHIYLYDNNKNICIN